MSTETQVRPFRIGLGEVSGAVADLGIFVPLATALILVNGLDAGAVLVCAGVLVIAAGLVFRIPFPVQPLKALTAIAVAQKLAPATISAAGIELGAILLLLTIGGAGAWVARWFLKPVIRALQVGVGILLMVGAWKLVASPPSMFQGVPSRSWILVGGVVSLAGVWVAARHGKPWVALGVLVAGLAATILAAPPALGGPSFSLPSFAIPDAGRVLERVLPAGRPAAPPHVRQRGRRGQRSGPRVLRRTPPARVTVTRLSCPAASRTSQPACSGGCRCATARVGSPPTSSSAPGPRG